MNLERVDYGSKPVQKTFTKSPKICNIKFTLRVDQSSQCWEFYTLKH